MTHPSNPPGTPPESDDLNQRAVRNKRQILGADATFITRGALVVLVAVLGVFAWGLVEVVCSTQNDSVPAGAQTLTLVGFLLTGGSLVVALFIFQVQKQENEKDRTSSKAQGDKVLSEVAGFKELLTTAQVQQIPSDLGRVDALDELVDDTERDPYEEEVDDLTVPTRDLISIGAESEHAEKFKVYGPTQIPIRVLADLYSGWTEMDDRGELDAHGITGWEAGEAVAYRRRRQGNHAWFIRLTNRDDPSQTYLWQVSRGGRGKPSPTVKQLSPSV